MNFTPQYRITDIRKALLENKEFEKQLYVLVQLALREFIGTRLLDEVLADKDAVTAYVKESVSAKAEALGVAISAGGIKDVILAGRHEGDREPGADRAEEGGSQHHHAPRGNSEHAQPAEHREADGRQRHALQAEGDGVRGKIAEKVGAITISGNAKVLDQLKELFSAGKGP